MLNRIRTGFSLFANYLSLLIASKKKPTHFTNEKYVFFDLKDIRIVPYHYALIFAFQSAGFGVFIRNNFFYIANSSKIAIEFFKLSSVNLVYRLPIAIPEYKCIYFYDRFVDNPKTGNWDKQIYIDADVYSFKPRQNAYAIMPFPVSPQLYVAGEHKRFKELRERNRTTRIFFSGNLDRDAYKHKIFKEFFHKLDRISVVDVLKEGLSDDQILIIQNESNIELSKDIKKPIFELYDWSWSPSLSRNLSIRIKNENWIDKLASSDFFLCAPGIRMPLCFNCVEAMAVGTIPVLEYPEYFNPPLQHLENAIVFSGANDLIEKIKMVLSMDKGSITNMSVAAAKYYDHYLHPSALVDNLEQFTNRELKLYIHAEQASFDDYVLNKKD